jgi:hypothetical protein
MVVVVVIGKMMKLGEVGLYGDQDYDNDNDNPKGDLS